MKSDTIRVLVILVSLCAAPAYSQLPTATPSSEVSRTSQITKASMQKFLQHFVALKKYLISDEDFQASQNFDTIQLHLRELAAEVKKTNHDFTLQQEHYRFSREALENHIIESERVFRLGNRAYARWMVNSTIGICMSCHTQVPVEGHPLSELKSAKIFSSDFDRAEFMFAVRDYQSANELFKKMVDKYPQPNLSVDKIEKSVKRQLAYTIRIKKDLRAAEAVIRESLKNNQLPEFLKRNLVIWNNQIKRWKVKKVPQFGKASTEQILQFVEKELVTDSKVDHVVSAEPRLISNLSISGLLYEVLQLQTDSTYFPRILFGLALSERELSQSFFFSPANLYLRECMLRFAASPIAPKCYREYESEMLYSYTGSAGVQLPEDVKADLKGLKSSVDSKSATELPKKSP